ncbi:hypothetical protein [Paludibacterium yongneupense]|uniref:hypothetical protein n=1 Tax=Paludibacterium yongneupense TaxID=400061 RepID=UPI00055CADDC|nr:hypothetical protein [Paludibacterium yongneupense]
MIKGRETGKGLSEDMKHIGGLMTTHEAFRRLQKAQTVQAMKFQQLAKYQQIAEEIKGTAMNTQIGFGPADGPKADIYKEADEFCAKQGKSVETITLQTEDSGFGKPASASLQFRCK